MLDLLAHHLDNLLGTVGIIGVGKHVLRGIESVGVFVAPENIDGIAADAQARARDQPGIDGIAHSGIGGSCALCPHIAFGGEAGHEVGLRRQRCQDGALRYRFFHGLQIFRARMQKQVDMRVNQPRHQGYIAEVDDLCPSRTADLRAGLGNALALNQHFARTNDLSTLNVEHSRCMQHDGLRLCLGESGDSQQETEGN